MAEYIRTRKLAASRNIAITGDWHVGAKAFHEGGARAFVEEVLERKLWVAFMGDAIEGKLVDSPHFNPDGLRVGQLNIKDQADHFIDLWRPIAKRTLVIIPGNHDEYLAKNFDVLEYVCEKLGVPRGGYQTWLDMGDITFHLYHGKRAMPAGAKDKTQREANQKAWLKRQFEDLAGSCALHAMGHTHRLLTLAPFEQWALLNGGDNVKARSFVAPTGTVDGMEYFPPDSRWYVNTGSFRRAGGFGYTDYCEIAGYAPQPIGWAEVEIKKHKIVNVHLRVR